MSIIHRQICYIRHPCRSNSIDYRSRHTTDMNELQKIIEEKRNLQHLQISL